MPIYFEKSRNKHIRLGNFVEQYTPFREGLLKQNREVILVLVITIVVQVIMIHIKIGIPISDKSGESRLQKESLTFGLEKIYFP